MPPTIDPHLLDRVEAIEIQTVVKQSEQIADDALVSPIPSRHLDYLRPIELVLAFLLVLPVEEAFDSPLLVENEVLEPKLATAGVRLKRAAKLRWTTLPPARP